MAQFSESLLDAEKLAHTLGISHEAADIYLNTDVIDLHIDSFIWVRLLGYDLSKRNDPPPLGARWLGQVDFPRLREARITGATWVITTYPLRSPRGRLRALMANLRNLRELIAAQSEDLQQVRSVQDYQNARYHKKHAVWFGIQGGDVLCDPAAEDIVPFNDLLLTTLVHMLPSALGGTSSPLDPFRRRGLTAEGHRIVELLESRGVLIDLAHASPQTFKDVVRCHDPSRPLIVSHTGFNAVHRSWRNLDDQQLDVIADSGGMVGVLFHGPFLGDGFFGGQVDSIARHLAHGIRRIGAAHLCLGSDWDGLIATPLDMPTCLELPRLVESLLRLNVSPEDIRTVLGRSFLQFLSRTA